MHFQSSGRYRNQRMSTVLAMALLICVALVHAEDSTDTTESPTPPPDTSGPKEDEGDLGTVQAKLAKGFEFTWKQFEGDAGIKRKPNGKADVYTDRVKFPTECGNDVQTVVVKTQVKSVNTVSLSVKIPCVLYPNEVLDVAGQSMTFDEKTMKDETKCRRLISCPKYTNQTAKTFRCHRGISVLDWADGDSFDSAFAYTNHTKSSSGTVFIDKKDFVMTTDAYCRNNLDAQGKLKGMLSHRYQRAGVVKDAFDDAYRIGEDTESLPYSTYSDRGYESPHIYTLAEDFDAKQAAGKLTAGPDASQPANEAPGSCGYNCHENLLSVFYKVDSNADVAFSIYVTDKCDWIAICVKALEEEKHYRCAEENKLVYIYLKNGFVVNVGRPIATPMRFFRTKEQDKTVVHFERKFVNTTTIYTTISNAFRQSTTAKFVNSGNYAIRFSSEKCLVKDVGIVFPGVSGKVVQSAGKISYASGDEIKFEGRHDVDETAKPTPPPTEKVTRVTQPVKIIPAPEGKGGDFEQKGDGTYKEGWLTWMAVAGFISGNVVALLISGGILYVGRRSFYGDWYRGMYKRYGTDASMMTGMTMNMAMNTTGAMTVGSTTSGGTTMGSTTGGGGTTMGGTTGGDMVTQ